MKLVETIELTQEYIDDAANYITAENALKVRLQNALTKEAWIFIFIPAPTEWQTSKPTLLLACNGMYNSQRTLSYRQLTPTAYDHNAHELVHFVPIGDCFFAETFISPNYKDAIYAIYPVDRKVMVNSRESSLFELDFKLNTSDVKMPAGTTIKIYSA